LPFVPNYADAVYGAQSEVDSGDFEILLDGLEGNGVVSGCSVSAQGTPNMTVSVSSGTVRISGSEVAVTSGNVTVTTADASLPRFDLIVVNSSGVKSTVAGTASATPAFPAIPSNSVVLAAVYLPPAATSVASNQITDKRATVMPNATTSAKGVVQLTDSTATASSSIAASATAVRNLASEARQDAEALSIIVGGDNYAQTETKKLVINPTSVTVASSTTVPVTGFDIPLPANSVTIIEYLLLMDTNATPDIRIGWTVPTGATAIFSSTYADYYTAEFTWAAMTTTAAGPWVQPFYAAVTTSTTPGVLQLRFGQATTTSGSPVTLRAGTRAYYYTI
jgi:hypothetical protein